MESTTRVSGADNESRWKIPKSYHISRHSSFRNKSKFASKVKCLTIQPPPVPAGKGKMILGLKEEKGYMGCEYEPSPPVESIQKKTKIKKVPGLPRRHPNLTSPSSSSLILRESATKAKNVPIEGTHFKGKDSVLTIEQEGLKYKPYNLPLSEKDFGEKPNISALKDEDADVLYDSPEHNEENSKAFMESIGSWINDLFSAPNKRSIVPKDDKEVHKELVSEEDAEYLKSISTIKEQFRKKLKNETTVHISSPETPFELNFDKVLDNPKKLKRKVKPQPPTASSDWLDELNEDLTEIDFIPRQHHTGGLPSALVIRSGESETQLRAMKQKNTLQLTSMEMPKERKKLKSKQQNRRDFRDLEEYAVPKAGELSKKILLNMSDQEKFSQFYKNAHLGAQDYSQRKGKGYQTNTRCYTTKAKGRGKLSMGAISAASRSSHYSSTVAPAKSFAEFLAKNPVDLRKNSYRNSSRKAISEMSRDTMTFTKMKTPTTFPTIHESKVEPKTNSDELLKSLMKRIKGSRQQLAKKKGRTRVPQVLGTGRNRFMQSATNSLVMTVIAKKEENSLASKSAPRLFGDNRGLPTKELVLKQSENDMRLDFAKPPLSSATASKFNKNTYLVDEGKCFEDEYTTERGSRRNPKQIYDDALKRESCKAEKYHKRQEVKRMLSNLEMKGVLPEPRSHLKKEYQRKQITEEENPAGSGSTEPQNPRFQKEHELFKRVIKTQMEQLEEAEAAAEPVELTVAKEVQEESTVELESPVTAELAVVEQTALEIDDQAEKIKPMEPEFEIVEQKSIVASSTKSNTEYPKKDSETLYRKPPSAKTDKRAAEKTLSPKEKGHRNKTPREHEHKSLMSPLMELCTAEIQREQKDMPKAFEVQIPPKELAGKSSEALLINRRYSTNSISDIPQGSKFLPWNYVSPSLYLLETDKDKKEKKKESCKEISNKDISKDSPKAPKTNGSHCGFDREKEKPGPDCSKE